MEKEQALHIEIVKSILHGDLASVSCRTCCASNCDVLYNASDEMFIDSEHYQGIKKVSYLFKSLIDCEVNFNETDNFCSDCVDSATKSFLFQTKCRKIESLRVKFLKLILEYAHNAKMQAHKLPSDATEMYVYIREPDYPLKEYEVPCLRKSANGINVKDVVIKKEPGIDEAKAKEKAFVCAYCEESFKTKHTFVEHIKETCLEGDPSAITNYLSKVFPKEDETKPSLICLICNKDLSYKQTLIQHLKLVCLKDDPEAVKQYVERYLPKRKKKKELDFHCPLCKKSYSLRHSLYLHLKEKCMQGKDRTTVLKFLKSIYRAPAKSKGSAKCLVCGNFYATRRSLLAHLKRNCMNGKPKDDIKEFFDKHYPFQKSNNIYVCPLCGKSTSTEAGLSDHTTICQAKRNPEIPREKFPCTVCDSVFYLKSGLSKHIDLVHSHKKFTCDDCGKTFKAKIYLRNHLIVHTRERNYSCDICHNKFINQRAVIIHRRIHTGEKPYPCSECNESFISQSRRSVHMKRKHLEPMFRCELCFRSFTAGYPLKKHLRTHNRIKVRDLVDKSVSEERIKIRNIVDRSVPEDLIKISGVDIKYELEETVMCEQ